MCMQCLQVMAAEISPTSSVGGKAAGWSEGTVAQHLIPISGCGFPKRYGSLEVDRWEKGQTAMFCGSGAVTGRRRQN